MPYLYPPSLARDLVDANPLLPRLAIGKLEQAAPTARVMRVRTARLKGGWCWRLDVYFSEAGGERSVILMEVPSADSDTPMSARFLATADDVFAYLQTFNPAVERIHITDPPKPRSPGWLRKHPHRHG